MNITVTFEIWKRIKDLYQNTVMEYFKSLSIYTGEEKRFTDINVGDIVCIGSNKDHWGFAVCTEKTEYWNRYIQLLPKSIEDNPFVVLPWSYSLPFPYEQTTISNTEFSGDESYVVLGNFDIKSFMKERTQIPIPKLNRKEANNV